MVTTLKKRSHVTESSPGEHAIIYEYYCLNARNHYMGLIQSETVRLESDDDVDAQLEARSTEH